jgi:hypothetical protein
MTRYLQIRSPKFANYDRVSASAINPSLEFPIDVSSVTALCPIRRYDKSWIQKQMKPNSKQN